MNITRLFSPQVGTSRDILCDLYLHISHNIPRESLVLKGGYLLHQKYSSPRMTMDIDYNCTDEWCSVKGLVIEFLEANSCKVTKVREPEEGTCAGVRFEFNGNSYGIDMNYNCKQGKDIVLTMVNGVDSQCYSLEQILADKITVLFSQKRFRRVKDLYDCHYILSDIGGVSLDKLAFLLNLSIDTIAQQYPFRADRLVGLESAYGKFVMRANVPGYVKPNFRDVVVCLDSFLIDLLEKYILTLGDGGNDNS